MNQRRFDNQPSDWLTAAEAAKVLGVKRATVYAYASRGWLGPATKGPGAKALYPRSSVERLRLRARARSGHAAVAAGALRWGEPVLDTAISGITPRGPSYRGVDAVDLARRDTPFEACAEWLWASARTDPWPAPLAAPSGLRLPPPGVGTTLGRLVALVSTVALADEDRFGASVDREHDRARRLIGLLAQQAGRWGPAPSLGRPVAAQLAHSLTGEAPSKREEAALQRALVLSADHELNASTFTARVAASAGCDLYACLVAALATLTGPRHGGACDRVEAALADLESPQRALARVRARHQRGEQMPGFEPVAYAHGDPRGALLLETALATARSARRMTLIRAAADAVFSVSGDLPSLDFGLVAVAWAVGLPPGAAGALFAVGRSAGWVAHVIEQRQSGIAIRPRARFTQVPPSAVRE